MEQQQDADRSGVAPEVEVGAILRQARERMGMTVEEVAGRLKFAPRQITALENGDFAQLPELTFVRGFVRSYARLLQLDDKPLLDALPGAPAREAVQVTVTRDEVPRRGSDQRQQNLFWLGGALVVVVIGIIAWKYDAGSATPRTAQDVNAAGTTANAGAPAEAGNATQGGAASAPVVAQGGGEVQTGGAEQLAGQAQPGGGTETAGETQAGGGASKGEEARAGGEVQSERAVQTGEGRRSAVAARSAAAATAVPKTSAPAASATLARERHAPVSAPASGVAAGKEGAARAARAGRLVHFEFEEDSWVEVKDGSGRLLLSMLGKQGTTQNVSGPLPLSIVVGNAKGVKLFYKGQRLDLLPMQGSDVARLKLE